MCIVDVNSFYVVNSIIIIKLLEIFNLKFICMNNYKVVTL